MKKTIEYTAIALAGLILGYLAMVGLSTVALYMAVKIERERRQFVRDCVQEMVLEHASQK